MNKVCPRCSIEKSINEFHKSKIRKDKLCIYCKTCKNELTSIWQKKKYKASRIVREDIIEKIYKYHKEYKDTKLLKRRLNYIKYAYGISKDQYLNQLILQEGKCKSCKEETTLEIDHNHRMNKKEDGFFRGLLCHKCNVIIGMANDNIRMLEYAIKYLKDHNGIEIA